ncbi:MAG: hypothetical protein F6J98_02335 [Moorea sp. SIO4G2]|nr:hypothetical protein [Moorena sp. SIO4G2]
MGIRTSIAAWSLTLSALAGIVGGTVQQDNKKLGQWSPVPSLVVALLGHVAGAIADKKSDEKELREQVKAVAKQVAEIDHYLVGTGESPTGDEGADLIHQKLKSIGIKVKFLEAIKGFSFDRYRFAPEMGQKIEAINGHETDLQFILKSPNPPIVSKSAQGICIDVPRTKRSILEYKPLAKPDGKLMALIGYTLTGSPYLVDLGHPNNPHILIGGCTGSGKTEAIKAIMKSICDWYTPSEVLFAIIDTKGLDFKFASAPNFSDRLWRPVVTEVENAVCLLKELSSELERRKHLADLSKEPRIILIHDEVTDITNSGIKEVKKEGTYYLSLIVRKGREPMINTIIGTQKPLASHLPSDIRDNLPVKIALRTSTREDGTTITGLSNVASEKLAGLGDALCVVPGQPLQHVQFPLVTVPFVPLLEVPDEDIWLTPKQAAEIALVTRRTLARWADAGKIEYRLTDRGHRRYNERSLLEKIKV